MVGAFSLQPSSSSLPVPAASTAWALASASAAPPITNRRGGTQSTTTTNKMNKATSLYALREATFGMGCFWEPSETLLKQPGVLATAVGYTGAPPSTNGSTRRPPPTYDTVCFGDDYVEAVRVVYDGSEITYETVLDYFYQYQKPGYTRQYASIIFASTDEEEKIAEQWKLDRSSSRDNGISPKQGGDTRSNFGYENVMIEPASSFYRAEEYHQRYWEKQRLRGLLGLLLIAGESGAYNTYVEDMIGTSNMANLFFGQSFDSLCGGIFLVSAGWMLVERLVASDVRELKPGDLTRQL